MIENIGLSGEPLVPEIQHLFVNGIPDPLPLPEYFNKTLHLQDFRARYQEYWSSTAEKTGNGIILRNIWTCIKTRLGSRLTHIQVARWTL